MPVTEIRIAGFGGQGVILSATVIGKAASIQEGGYATMTQSFGPEARGGAASAQVILSDKPVLYPYVTRPDILVVIDTLKEQIAIQEANVLNIPVVAVCDSNSDPTNVTYPVPGNDDATRAIATYCELFSAAVLDGLQQEAISHGKDIGEAAELPAEALPAAAGEEAAQSANA